ncbi:MAG: hypothetical protein KJ947_04450 [Alphaproteobacteria bacterium]|jgi:hypothetical protein|nr:hypothetical protein [Alphaproteobacteria bacterium]MBU1548815.1 hypothetical protein [Alphaproteobacteria bacterium]MBU2335641.1 hypothetical protein [Alphaproteobacteria bacterium]MBU2390964.1 hypothetical protein [Alphaproteobacteria bacterium]
MRTEHHQAEVLDKLRRDEPVEFVIPETTTYANPSTALQLEDVLAFEGVRLPSVKSPFNYRGAQVDTRSKRLLPFESKVEDNAATIFQAMHEIVEIRPQAVVLKWVAANGERKKHIIDFLLRTGSGKTILVAAKPILKLIETNLIGLLLSVSERGLDGVADAVTFVTEKFASDEAAFNADQILLARRVRNEREYEIALDLLKNIRGQVRFRDLLATAEIRAHRRTAIWNLIDEGRLQPVSTGRIEDDAILTAIN